ERMYAKNAFVNGVPSAIAYDIVETEDGYGLVFEMAGATTVSKYIMEHPDKLQEYSIKLGVLLKTLNNTEADPERYGNIKQIYLDRARKAGEFFTDDEVDQMIRMINSIPEGTGMIHGDFHTNNVMVQSDGELILIDMADISRGNPIYDIGGAFLTMYLSGMKNPDITREVIGIDYEMSKQVWGIMLSTYYGTTDPDKLEMISKKIGAFALLRMGTTVALGERAKQSAPGIVTLLRQKLFPNTDALCQLFAMP
ncbi:MAG: phosphotransferase, partial [Lachnospiraceae bacterium]|nr:phosphotransferase [Lachnospiraceae bacterium]